MDTHDPNFVPPFCPRASCHFHRQPDGWRFRPFGTFTRKARPQVIRRFRCLACGRCFSTQTFDTTYWLKRPDIQRSIFLRLVECGALRQVGRGLDVVNSTVQRQAERLGRHCLLFQQQRAFTCLPDEPLALDGLQSFEYSQYWPCDLNLLIGSKSHFLHGFSDAELRRSGRMTSAQKARRAVLEQRHGRPDPQATERSVTELLARCVPEGASITLLSDQHAAYRSAVRLLAGRQVQHLRTSSKRARTPSNPLFAVNLADLLIRHSGANHKRETVAFSKRRQGALERLAVFQVWRNFMKVVSEREPRGPTPAMRVGVERRRLDLDDVLHRRLFPTLIELPARLADYYWRRIETREVPNGRRHALKHAF